MGKPTSSRHGGAVRRVVGRALFEVHMVSRFLLVTVLTVLVVLGGGCAGPDGEPEPRAR
jgi:hypothetical protein